MTYGSIIRPVMERSVYRIIDANFNRAREAVRVMEDYCRFVLDLRVLSGRAKQLRHELSAAVERLDSARLIASRDTSGDVGIGQRVEKTPERRNLKDSFTAGAKRLVEALRVLAEAVRPVDPALAETFEQLRYRAYTLEKDIVIFSEAAERFRGVRLYVIISNNLPSEILSLAAKCAASGADCIQLRAKDVCDEMLYPLACELVNVCRDADVLSVINDRVDIAVAADADGVHLGQRDLPVEQARKLQRRPLIIGRSTHSAKELGAAVGEYPTYVGLGAVYATKTKSSAKVSGLEYIKEALESLRETGIAHVAIGGITPDNVEQVLQAGARAVAVCSVVNEAAEPGAICRALKDKISAFGNGL